MLRLTTQNTWALPGDCLATRMSCSSRRFIVSSLLAGPIRSSGRGVEVYCSSDDEGRGRQGQGWHPCRTSPPGTKNVHTTRSDLTRLGCTNIRSRAYRWNGGDKECIQNLWWGNFLVNVQLEDRKGDGKIILRWMLWRQDVRIEGGMNSFKIVSYDGLWY
jgi:hypothetical protein